MKIDALDRKLLGLEAEKKASPISTVDGLAFMTALHKMAEEGALPQPDTSGAVEGPFLAPLPDVVQLMAQMVSNEFKTQTYYVYYANMLRGLSHEGVAEEFMEHAAHELEHANYLLRRMGVLSPGGVSIPPYPPPEPLADPDEIVQAMIVVEQMGLSLWKQLLAVMGENPMRYTIEEFLQREEEHQDELWQLVQAPTPGAAQPMAPEAPVEEKPQPASTKVQVTTQQPQAEPTKEAQVQVRAHIRGIAARAAHRKAERDPSYKKTSSVLMTEWVHTLRERANEIEKKDQRINEATPTSQQTLQSVPPFEVKKVDNTAKPKDVSGERTQHSATSLVGLMDRSLSTKKAFGEETAPIEGYLEEQEHLNAQQAMAEAAHAKTISMQSAQAAQQAQAEASAAQQQLAETQQALEQAQAENQQNSVQTLQATQQAAEAESRAADHSISKMQLGMRVNQMRQELANFVMQDPVAESAATVSDLAAQGMPATPMQQQQAEQQAQQQALTGEQPPSAETQDDQAEAERAQQDASTQQQQADQSAQKDEAKSEGGAGGKPGTHVTVKTSNVATDAVRSVGHATGEGLAQGIGHAIAETAKRHSGAIAGTAVGAAGVGALAHAQGRENRRQDVAEGVRRGMKTSALADRRLAREVMAGPKDELGNALREILHKGMPGEAAQAALGAKVKEVIGEGADMAKETLPDLLERARPHAPAFLGGLGAGILGTKALSRTPAASTNYADQYYQ